MPLKAHKKCIKKGEVYIIHNLEGKEMIYKGFKFGMLLQLAIGPMCLMVFNTSTTYGFWMGLSLV